MKQKEEVSFCSYVAPSQRSARGASSYCRKSTLVNNSTMNSTDNGKGVQYFCDDMFNFATIGAVFFSLVFILSIAGNGLLLCVLVIYENLKNITNLFVLNLAFSDLVFTITLPFWTANNLHRWSLNEFWCKFVVWAYNVGLYTSIILLTAMTVDRFITVVLDNWPNKGVKRQWCAIGACVAAWVISIIASIPEASKAVLETYQDNITVCSPPASHDLTYYLQVSLLFFVPLVIIVFCYSAILKTVLQSTNRRKHRAVVVVLCIVAAFILCWGPYNILFFIVTLYKPKGCVAEERIHIIRNICEILAFSHCCMNPLFYMISEKLQKHLLHFIFCKTIRKKNSQVGILQCTCSVPGTTSVLQNSVQNSAGMLELQSVK